MTRTHAHLAVAIDGPAASGKTAVGTAVAKRLGIRFLDTGAMYRAVSWAAIQHTIDPCHAHALSRLASSADIRLLPSENGDRLLFDGEDITDRLRLPEVDAIVSKVSAVSGVRTALVAQQRRIAAAAPIVMVGRDIGSVVLPHAAVKIYLTASAETRAQRRCAELAQPIDGQEDAAQCIYAQTLAGIRRRDHIDSARTDSPLRPADDATLVHTDALSLDETIAKALAIIEDAT